MRIFSGFRRLATICLASLAGFSPLHAASLLDELNSTQKRALKNGSQILVTEDIEGEPWPRATIYELVAASPEEVAAVFFDFEDNKSYIPNVLDSKISKTHAPHSKEVDFAINIPIFADEFYTVRNTLSKNSSENYCIEWKLVRAVQTKNSVGSFCVTPFENGTLMRYRNLVTPGSKMAPLLRGFALSQMKDVAAAIAERAVKLKSSNPEKLAKQVKTLRSALGE